MSRRSKQIKRRDVGVDTLYQSELVQRLINVVMWRGKKNIARKIVYKALLSLEKKFGGKKEGLDAFHKAYNEIVPAVEVRSRRVGGSVYQVPREVNDLRKRSLALRWLINAAKDRQGKDMGEKLGYELIDAYYGKGGASKKKQDLYRMAESNRAFSHFSW